jgi:CYTH domain-containing protein
MAGNLEIELKFLARQRPEGLPKAASSRIVQGYFPLAKRDLEIRLRRKGSQHFITIKVGKGRKRLEVEIKITGNWKRAC